MSSPDRAVPTYQTSGADGLAEQVEQLYRAADHVLATEGLAAVSDETIQQLMTLAVKLYVARREHGSTLSPFVENESVSATDVSVTIMGMLKAVNLDLFEVSLWRHWGRIERGAEESQQEAP
jgi:hypothetical protein